MRAFAATAVAAVSGALGAAVLVGVWQPEAQYLSDCQPQFLGDCLRWRLLWLPVVPLLVIAAVWLALRLLRVPRPWLAALLGAVGATGAILLYEAGQPRLGPLPSGAAAGLAAAGCAVGCLVGTLGMRAVVRVGLVVVLLVPFAVFPTLRKVTRRAELRADLGRIGLPLLVPSVEGYQVDYAGANLADGVLAVTVANDRRWISSYTIRVPEGFAPPQRCGPTVSDVFSWHRDRQSREHVPCQEVAPGHWVRTERDVEVHLVRYGDALVLVGPGSLADAVPPADVHAAATALVEVTPGRLAELAVR